MYRCRSFNCLTYSVINLPISLTSCKSSKDSPLLIASSSCSGIVNCDGIRFFLVISLYRLNAMHLTMYAINDENFVGLTEGMLFQICK